MKRPIERPIIGYGLEADGHYGASGTRVVCADCFQPPLFPATITPLTQVECDLNRDAMQDLFLCEKCGKVLSA
jgi:hypothetical protein